MAAFYDSLQIRTLGDCYTRTQVTQTSAGRLVHGHNPLVSCHPLTGEPIIARPSRRVKAEWRDSAIVYSEYDNVLLKNRTSTDG